MSTNAIIKSNICNLMEAQGLNPSSLAKLVESLGFKITRSYMSKLIDPKREPLNLSVDKLEAIAGALRISAQELMLPISIGEDGSVKSPASELNVKVLTDAIRQVKLTAREVGIDNVDFESQAIPIVYMALATENTEKLNTELIKLARKY